MFNLVLGSLMLRIAEVTADYTTGGAWYTGEPDSYQDGLSPPRSSAEVASCLAPVPQALEIPELVFPRFHRPRGDSLCHQKLLDWRVPGTISGTREVNGT